MLKFFMDTLLALASIAFLIPGSVKPTLQTTFMAQPDNLYGTAGWAEVRVSSIQ
jgi:hypothetical protein